jgi:protein-L-isoaspartate(D-aspartate) O-methyltransferase
MASRADRERAAMVERLRARGITDERVLSAMGSVPRERFVPRDMVDAAYQETPLPIGLGQTISAPLIVAFSTAALQAGTEAHVLEIGTGSGYGAAVLSRCHRSVVTIERHAQLADRARAVLVATGCDNVEVRTGDGALGVPDRAPFDGIVVTAMAEGGPPPALLDQLAPHAALVCPVGRRGYGILVRYRGGEAEHLGGVAFVPLVTGG